MNVELPNGVIITDAPDDITQEQLRSFALDNNLATEDDFAEVSDDETSTIGAIGEAFKRIPGGFIRGVTSTVTGAGQLIPGLDDEALVETQRDIDEGIRDFFGYDPEYDDSNVAAVGEAVGQIGSFLIPGLGAAKLANVGRAARYSGIPSQFVGTAGVGKAGAFTTTAVASSQSLAQGAEERQRAVERGIDISTGERLASKTSDIAIGALETVGMPFRILKGFPKNWHKTPEGSGYMQRMVRAAKNLETKRGVALGKSAVGAAAREGVQESLSSIARELSAKAIYDPDRKIGESWADDFQVGAGAGGIFDLGFNLATGRFKRKAPDAPPEIKPPTEAEEANEQELRAAEAEAEQSFKAAAVAGAVPGLSGPYPAAFEIPLERLEQQYDPMRPDARPLSELGIPDVDVYNKILEERKTKKQNLIDSGDAGTVEPVDRNEAQADLIDTDYGEAPTEIPPDELEDTLQIIAQKEAAELAPLIQEEQELRTQLAEESALLEKAEKDLANEAKRNLQLAADPRRDDLLMAVAKLGGINTELARADGFDIEVGKSRGKPREYKNLTGKGRAAFRNEGKKSWNLFEDKGGLSFDEMGGLLADAGFYPLAVDGKPDANQALTDIMEAYSRFESTGERTYVGDKAGAIDSLRDNVNRLGESADSISYELEQAVNRNQRTEFKIRSEARRAAKAAKEKSDPKTLKELEEFEQILKEREAIEDTPDQPDQAPRTLADIQAENAELNRYIKQLRRVAPKRQADRESMPLAQTLRGMLAKFGIADQYTTRLVDQVGKATFDADGDLIIETDPEIMALDAAEGRVTEGSFDPLAKVIQISLDRVKAKVEEGGLTMEEAVADVLNHEVIHALRRLDVFTAQEMSLLERLSRQYIKPDTNMSYTAWASRTYKDRTAVEMQEEAIAEMLRDALTGGVNIEGKVVKPTGKVRQLVNKVVNLFKGIINIGRQSDSESFADLVNAINSGEVGARQRGVIRTLRATEAGRKEIEERGILPEVLGYMEGQQRPRPRRTAPRQQAVADKPDIPIQQTIDVATDQPAPVEPPPVQPELAEQSSTIDREAQPRAHDPVKVEEAVEQNREDIRNNPTIVPRHSATASPDAQYVGRNPEAAAEPTPQQQYSRQQYEGQTDAGRQAVEDLTSNETPQTPIETFNEVTDIGPIKKAFLYLKTQFVDKYAVLGRYYKLVPELRDLEADSSALAAILFSDRAKGILASAIKSGVAVYRGGVTTVEDFFFRPLPEGEADTDGYQPKTTGKQYAGLIEVMSLLYSKERGDMTRYAQAYAMVLRGEILDADGKVTPVTPEKAAAVKAEIDALTDENGYNPVKEWNAVWQAYNAKTIDFLLATGMLNAKTAEQWKSSAYIPFYREAGGEGEARGIFGASGGGNLTLRGEFKKYQGSEKGVDVGLIESISLNLSAAIELGMKNVAQQRIVRDMQRLGLAEEGSSTDQHSVRFKVDGEDKSFIIKDRMLFDSLQSIGSDAGMSVIAKVLGKPATFLREAITRDPGFMMANIMRDTLSAWVTSGADFVPLKDSLANLRGSIDVLERAGVVGGYDYSNDPEDIGKFFEKEMSKRQGDLSALGLVTKAWDGLGSMTTASDAATRMAVYKDVLARTGNEAEALFQAMEVINFSRRGASATFRTITAAIPFLNARIQGVDVFWRAATGGYTANKELSTSEAAVKMLTRGSLLAGLTLIYYALVSDNEQYQEQTEVTRDNNWIIPTVWGVPIKLPIPFEVGVLFKTIPETVVAATVGDKSGPEVRDTAFRAITSTFEINPLGIQAFGPLAEAALNYNSFTGRPIVPYYMNQGVADGLQDRFGTSELAKVIGQQLGISPLKIDHVLYGYTGTLGSYVLDTVDVAMRSEAIQGDDRVKAPSLPPYDYPIIKRFFADKEGGGLREDAYDLYREVLTVRSTINKLKKEGRMDELERYLVGREHLIEMKNPVYKIKSALDKVRTQRNRILRADIDAELKREYLDELDRELNEQLKLIPRLKKYADQPIAEIGVFR